MTLPKPGHFDEQPPVPSPSARQGKASEISPAQRAEEAGQAERAEEAQQMRPERRPKPAYPVQQLRVPVARPCPDGWFAVASSAEMRPGRVVTRRLAGEDVVLYRTASGQLRAVRPFCPHLGAHLGHGGRVRGENLVCPFHHFEFGPQGACVKTGYGTPAPKARLAALECREVAGLVFVWRHARGEGSSWEIVAPPAEDFCQPYLTVRTLVAHPQDFMENVIDTGHFAPVHKIALKVIDAPRFDGPRMEAAYRLGRTLRTADTPAPAGSSMRAVVQGLGIFFTESHVEKVGLDFRAWFCVVPLDATRIDLRLAVSLRFPRVPHRGAARALATVLAGPLSWVSTWDTNKDIRIWSNNTYLEHPRLAQGDGPITKYRRWARQFYSDWPTG
ncbi:Rieske 2Fe-2S domain-containing protein [Streptomyces zagrosensis]|uniref:cholesterol 7-desaturase n=1 Tax=Streptomyces zagrosensis TaxID=1042984 RepID=A0A7W9QDN9_9ACTN|nr:Rieske 2Fe-2S domain-containing protein [Streptomyces zagrosensis]MBB5938350.1 nitrite reductase/ring-hydroxylating ferredoxin subunit [Streptomyces zagrosensis]